jgi:hemolysin D
MVVVPKDQDLIVEAMVSNSDVGFVHPGQDVELKVETFTFTRYGLLHGKVLDVSRDVVTPGDPRRNIPGDESASSRDPGQSGSPAYAAHIRLDQNSIMVDGQMQPLSSGMAVTAEIKTGRRTIIEFLLSPLVRHIDESLQER